MNTRSTATCTFLILFSCLFAFATKGGAQDVAEAAQGRSLDNPFYAFNNSMRGKGPTDPVEQAALLAELGFDGFEGHDLDELPRLAEELHARKLKVCTIYFQVDIDAEEDPYDPRIAEYLATFLENRGVILTVHLHSKRFQPSDPAGDELAVPILQELADLAHDHGAQVAVYNHANFWAEGIDDGIRLSKKVNRRNFGAAFNLCHWLWLEGEQNLVKRLDEVLPYLLSVTICGAEGGPEAKSAGWDRLIQPLDRGSFDNYAFLEAVIERGYTGPIGLQCYSIPLPAREHLGRSMKTWQEFRRRFQAEEAAKPGAGR